MAHRVFYKKKKNTTRKDPSTIIHPIYCYGSGFVICISVVQRSQLGAKSHPLQAVQIHSETYLEQRACPIYAMHQ